MTMRVKGPTMDINAIPRSAFDIKSSEFAHRDEHEEGIRNAVDACIASMSCVCFGEVVYGYLAKCVFCGVDLARYHGYTSPKNELKQFTESWKTTHGQERASDRACG